MEIGKEKLRLRERTILTVKKNELGVSKNDLGLGSKES